VEESRRDHDQAVQRMAEISDELERLKRAQSAEVAKKTDGVEVSRLTKELDEARRAQQSDAKKVAELSEEIKNLRAQGNPAKEPKKSNQMDITRLTSELEESRLDKQQTAAKVNELSQEIESLRAQLDAVKDPKKSSQSDPGNRGGLGKALTRLWGSSSNGRDSQQESSQSNSERRLETMPISVMVERERLLRTQAEKVRADLEAKVADLQEQLQSALENAKSPRTRQGKK
jgi:hypothetical protein